MAWASSVECVAVNASHLAAECKIDNENDDDTGQEIGSLISYHHFKDNDPLKKELVAFFIAHEYIGIRRGK